MTWSITVRIRPTSKHAEFLVPVGTHSSVSRLWSHTAIGLRLGNLLTLKSLTFRTSFSIFHCLPALSIPRAGEAITKTIPRDRRKLIKLMLRKSTFLPPLSHLIGQFIKRHLVTIRREQHVLAQWLRQYFCGDHGVRSVGKAAISSLFQLLYFAEIACTILSTKLWMQTQLQCIVPSHQLYEAYPWLRRGSHSGTSVWRDGSTNQRISHRSLCNSCTRVA